MSGFLPINVGTINNIATNRAHSAGSARPLGSLTFVARNARARYQNQCCSASVIPQSDGPPFHRRDLVLESLIISTAEVFFQPHVEANKKIPASHFFDLQLGSSSAAVAPGDRDSGP